MKIFALDNLSRQKRCIVIQKQSGGKADSGEGADDGDYDYKGHQPKSPPPDRLQNNAGNRKHEIETLSPELLKYKEIPNKAMYRRLRMKNRMMRYYSKK